MMSIDFPMVFGIYVIIGVLFMCHFAYLFRKKRDREDIREDVSELKALWEELQFFINQITNHKWIAALFMALVVFLIGLCWPGFLFLKSK